MNTEIEKEVEEKKYMSTSIPLASLEKYQQLGWSEVSRKTNLCGTFVTIRREIRGKL